MVSTGSDVCCNTAFPSISAISKKKSCVAVFLTPFLGTRSASGESVRMADELTRTKVTEWTDDGWVRRYA